MSLRQKSARRAGLACLASSILVAGACARTQQAERPLAGEEAPIRVRNGSVELKLVHGAQAWEDIGQRKRWRVLGEPERGKDNYEVIVTGSDLSGCRNGVVVTTANKVEIETDGRSKVVVQLTNKKTTVTTDAAFSPGGATIEGPSGAAFIANVKAGQLECTFSRKDEQLRVLLIDE